MSKTTKFQRRMSKLLYSRRAKDMKAFSKFCITGGDLFTVLRKQRFERSERWPKLRGRRHKGGGYVLTNAMIHVPRTPIIPS